MNCAELSFSEHVQNCDARQKENVPRVKPSHTLTSLIRGHSTIDEVNVSGTDDSFHSVNHSLYSIFLWNPFTLSTFYLVFQSGPQHIVHLNRLFTLSVFILSGLHCTCIDHNFRLFRGCSNVRAHFFVSSFPPKRRDLLFEQPFSKLQDFLKIEFWSLIHPFQKTTPWCRPWRRFWRSSCRSWKGFQF